MNYSTRLKNLAAFDRAKEVSDKLYDTVAAADKVLAVKRELFARSVLPPRIDVDRKYTVTVTVDGRWFEVTAYADNAGLDFTVEELEIEE